MGNSNEWSLHSPSHRIKLNVRINVKGRKFPNRRKVCILFGIYSNCEHVECKRGSQNVRSIIFIIIPQYSREILGLGWVVLLICNYYVRPFYVVLICYYDVYV